MATFVQTVMTLSRLNLTDSILIVIGTYCTHFIWTARGKISQGDVMFRFLCCFLLQCWYCKLYRSQVGITETLLSRTSHPVATHYRKQQTRTLFTEKPSGKKIADPLKCAPACVSISVYYLKLELLSFSSAPLKKTEKMIMGTETVLSIFSF